MGGDQNDDANRAIVHEVRSQLDPSIFGSLPNVQTYVTGEAAASVDVTQVYADGIPLIFLFVLGLSFLLMLVAFHSIVIPIKAIILNLLSTAAAYGVLVLVFESGWFAGPLGITPSGVIESWVPLFIFTILFGLSMDYHLFILTRIKEARDRGLESRAAVAKGISVTAGVDHQCGLDHGRRLRGLRDPQVRVHPAARARARGRGVHRRDGHPERPPAGVDDAARRLELVDAALPRLDPAGHDRGRSGRTGRAESGSRSRRPGPLPDRARSSPSSSDLARPGGEGLRVRRGHKSRRGGVMVDPSDLALRRRQRSIRSRG